MYEYREYTRPATDDDDYKQINDELFIPYRQPIQPPATDEDREDYRIERAVRREEQANQPDTEGQYDGTRFL